MLKIIGRRTSGNVMKPLWAADELGLEYEQVDVGGKFGGNDTPEYLAMNPMGLVPTLVDGDFTMFESNAITRYIAQKYGQGSLWPDDPHARATADTWMDWKLNVVNSFMRIVFWGLVRTKPEDRDLNQIKAGIEQGCKFCSSVATTEIDRTIMIGDHDRHLSDWGVLIANCKPEARLRFHLQQLWQTCDQPQPHFVL